MLIDHFFITAFSIQRPLSPLYPSHPGARGGPGHFRAFNRARRPLKNRFEGLILTSIYQEQSTAHMYFLALIVAGLYHAQQPRAAPH